MTPLQKILAEKKYPVILSSELLIKDVLKTFKAKRIRAAIVSNDGKRVDGLLSERDIILGLEGCGAEILDKQVGDIMTEKVVTCTVDASLAGLMAQMHALNIRNIPVISDTSILGVVTMRDLVNVRLNQVQTDADAMRNYIANG